MPLPPNIEYDSRANLLRARCRGPFLGLDSTSSLLNMDLLSLREAKNVNIEEDGTLNTRSGYTPLLTSAWGTKNITQGVEYLHGSQTDLIVFGHEVGLTTGALGSVDAAFASVTDIATGLSNSRPSIVQFKDLLFINNGANDLLYDGNATRQIGITAPASAPTLNSTINGSLVVGQIYVYSYTYYNSVTGAESSPSALFTSAAVAADPNDGFRLNVTPGDSATADTIRLYRTVAGGVVLQLDTTALISATTIDSTQADAGLGKEIELDNTRPGIYGAFKYNLSLNNRVYLTGLSTNPNRVHVSAIYTEGPRPESFPVDKIADCQSSKGDTDGNVGFGVAGGVAIVIKKSSVGRIEALGADLPSSSSDPVIFNYKEISRSVSGISHFAGTGLYENWVWLGEDNIYITDGSQVRPIADKITTTIKSYGFTQDNSFTAINDKINRRLYFAIKTSQSKQVPDLVIVGHYSTAFKEGVEGGGIAWTTYTPGLNPVDVPGISAASFFSCSDFDGVRRYIFGNTAYNGQIYFMNNSKLDDGNPIYMKLVFAPITFSLDEEEKLYIKDDIVLKGDGANYSVTASSIYNLKGGATEQELLSLAASTDIWGGTFWLGGFWNAITPQKESHNLHTKALSKQLQLEGRELTGPVTIYNYTTLARPTAYRG